MGWIRLRRGLDGLQQLLRCHRRTELILRCLQNHMDHLTFCCHECTLQPVPCIPPGKSSIAKDSADESSSRNPVEQATWLKQGNVMWCDLMVSGKARWERDHSGVGQLSSACKRCDLRASSNRVTSGTPECLCSVN